MIKNKINNILKFLEGDSEEDILENQNDIKKYIEKFDQNTKFLEFFKNELKNVVIQLNLQE